MRLTKFLDSLADANQTRLFFQYAPILGALIAAFVLIMLTMSSLPAQSSEITTETMTRDKAIELINNFVPGARDFERLNIGEYLIGHAENFEPYHGMYPMAGFDEALIMIAKSKTMESWKNGVGVCALMIVEMIWRRSDRVNQGPVDLIICINENDMIQVSYKMGPSA